MKITSVDVIALEAGRVPMSQAVLCRVNTDEGVYGYGEAGATFITGSMACFWMLRDFAKLVVGMNPLDNDVIWDKLYKTTFWGSGNGAVVMSAISAIDTALWDIKGKICKLPVYQLLGGKYRGELRAYASQLQFGWGQARFQPQGSREDYLSTARRAVEQGYTAVKVDVLKYDREGKPLPHNIGEGHLSRDTVRLVEERLGAVREGVGTDVEIIVENHGRTDANTTLQLAEAAGKYDIMLLEETGALLNPDLMKEISNKCAIPLAAGERAYTRWGFRPFILNRSLSVIQPDLGTCGGLTEGRKIASLAELYDIGVQAHVCCSPISVAASLHFEAALPNFIIHEHHVGNTLPASVENGLYDYQPRNGCIAVPELPGLGQELSEKALHSAAIETVK